MKRALLLNQAKWLVEPGCVVLITAGTMQKANVMTISWQTPVHTADPCLVLLVMHQGRYTYELIRQNNELVINVPGENLLEQTHLVGTVSGRKIDKFKEAGLTPAAAHLVQPPLIAECAGHLECQVIETFTVKTHDLLICEVIHASVEEDLLRRRVDSREIPYAALHERHPVRPARPPHRSHRGLLNPAWHCAPGGIVKAQGLGDGSLVARASRPCVSRASCPRIGRSRPRWPRDARA